MKRLLLLGMLALGAAACQTQVDYSPEAQNILHRLDRTILDKSSFEIGKEHYLTRIKAKITPGCQGQQLYTIYDDLYSEYYNYNLDSAMLYAKYKFEVAQQGADPRLIHDATLDLSDLYVLAGMYAEAKQRVSQLDLTTLDLGLYPRYYHVYHSLYKGMETMAVDPTLREAYRQHKVSYRQELLNRLGQDDIARLFVRTDILRDEGRSEEALKDLQNRYNTPGSSTHERAVLAYLLASLYHQQGQKEQAVIYYAESAIFDLQTPVHEYKSLYELAATLYEQGDIERAYRYINCSVSDAMTANARINIHYINQLLPIISHSYDKQMKQKNRQLNHLVWSTNLLSLLLIAAAIIAFKGKRRASDAEAQTRKMNDELRTANTRLHKYINLLQESNNIKEAYIGRYLDLCSDYISRLESYRQRISKVAKNGTLSDVHNTLKSTSFIDSELEEFYARFDATFLHIFPNFVEQFNALLQLDKQVEVRPGEAMLTTELRIFALIRLGIGDSVKIAEFLRRSVSTVYNYRVKMRNAAKNDREDFEKCVMRIGRLS